MTYATAYRPEFYKPAPPPAPVLPTFVVWGKTAGEPAQMFEAVAANIEEAIGMVLKAGLPRAMVQVK